VQGHTRKHAADSRQLVKDLNYGVMNLDLTDEETTALARLLSDTIEGDRFPLSPRILTLRAIRAKLRPEPVGEPLSPRKHYEPPQAAGARRRRAGR